MKKTIVFVICHGRSGSTLLSKFLGINSNAIALSEPVFFDTQHALGELCSCEKTYYDCDFWKYIRKEMGIKDGELEKFNTSKYSFVTTNKIMKLLNYISLYCYTKFSVPFVNKKYVDQINNEVKLLDTIARVRGEEVIIDASKNMPRAIFLKKVLGSKYNIKFVYLKRDPRSVIASQKKKDFVLELGGKETVLTKDKQKFDFDLNLEQVRRIEKNNKRLFKVFGVEKLDLVYEDFATNPKEAFKELGAYIGLKWEDNMLDLDSCEQHLLGGNYSRIKAKSIHPPKTEWNELLTSEELNRINGTFEL